MERLTYYSMKGSENDGWYLKPGVTRETALTRLAAYENTGLTPEMFQATFTEEALLKLTAQALKTTPDRLLELVKADSEGLLVVLPELPRVVAGRYECGRFYSELTGEEVSKILNAYANGKLAPATEETKC